jgi:hypothetical protein
MLGIRHLDYFEHNARFHSVAGGFFARVALIHIGKRVTLAGAFSQRWVY